MERRLAAILAADVVGFSALMERDEEGTYSRIGRLRRDVIEPRLSEHQGRLIKTTGDGFLAEFASPIAALRCALVIQSNQLDEPNPLQLRIGLNLGDVIIEEGGDVYGEGVNVAARLEGFADPGGILISGKIYNEVEGKVDATFEDRGDQQVKNITRPVRIYAVRSATAPIKSASIIAAIDNLTPLALPDKPSIAVLPFQNMSGDPEQEYFADGVVEDIITALSRFKSLFVIARNSTFTYKGKAVDVKQVGRELGVRYVLEGSVRKAGERVRITGQLVDTTVGSHIWAEKFDGELHDIFALQDAITEKVAAVIEPSIKRAEIERAVQRRTNNLSAYDLYLRALPRYYSLTEDGLADSLGLCHRALDLDARYIAALRLAAEVLGIKVAQGWSTDVQADYAEAFRLGRLALEIDDTDPDTLSQMGRGLAAFLNEYENAKDMVDRAVALNPNSARAWSERGWAYRYMKEADEALKSFDRAIRLNPIDPKRYDTLTGIASTLITVGRDEEAVAQARRAIAANPRFTSAHRCLAAALAYLGRESEAKAASAALLEIEPSFRIGKWAAYGGQWQGQRFLDGLRLAGLPE